MDAPQSDAEVRPVVDQLRLIDSRLDVVWNPRAFVERRGAYAADGKLVAPVYAGRWEVILHDTSAQTATWRPYTLVCRVTAPAADAVPGVPTLTHNGPYAPVGEWLVAHIRSIDAANAASVAELSARLDVAWAKQERAQDEATGEAVRAAADRVYCDAVREGGVAVFHPVTIDLTRPTAAATA